MGKESIMTVEGAVEEFADMVYRIALVEVKNKADAEDVFQEVFVRLVKHIHTLESREHIKAWLIRVTINCSRKHQTSFWNRNVGSLEEEQGTEEDGYRMEEESPVRAAVMELPEKYRTVVHLFYYEELTVNEICKFLKQKESTIKSQLFRARELLRDKLEGEIYL